MTAKYRKRLLILLPTAGVILIGWLMVRVMVQRAGGVPLDRHRTEELRRQLDSNPHSIFTFDPQLSYRLKPSFRGLRHDSTDDFHITNSRGLLGESEVTLDPAVEKILFLGDSVAYGSHLPFEDIFITRMAKAAGDHRQLLNAGCPGWSTHQELGFYQLYLADLPIDTVVIVFTLNDLLRFEWVWRDEQSFQMSAELRGLGGLVQSRWTARELTNLRDRFQTREDLRSLAELNNTCLAAYLPDRWNRFEEEIGAELRELEGSRRLILAASPGRPQLEALNAWGDPEAVLYPQRRLEELARAMGIAFLDLLPAFRQSGGDYDIRLFLPGEPGVLHLSPEGHLRLAEWLWPEIERRTGP